MKITKETKIKDLFEAYPFVKEEILEMKPDLKALDNKIGMAMVGNFDLEGISKRVDVDVDKLIKKLEVMIEEEEKNLETKKADSIINKKSDVNDKKI